MRALLQFKISHRQRTRIYNDIAGAKAPQVRESLEDAERGTVEVGAADSLQL